MKFAVTALIRDNDHTKISGGIPHFVAVTRKNHFWDYSLPGGKVEDGESLEEALVREVKEETGLTLTRYNPVFCGLEVDYNVTTYLSTRYEDTSGILGTSEPIIVDTLSIYDLIAGTFCDYNTRLFLHLYPEFERSIRAFSMFSMYVRHIHPEVSILTRWDGRKCTAHISVAKDDLHLSRLSIHMLDDAFSSDSIDFSINIR